MSPFFLSFLKLILPIKNPRIDGVDSALAPVVCENIDLVFDKIDYYRNLDGKGFEIDCRIGVDVITSRPIKSVVIEHPIPVFLPVQFIEIQQNLDYLEAIRVSGMNYSNRIGKEINIKNDEPVIYKKGKKTSLFTKSYIEAGYMNILSTKHNFKSPSFWDLIYVLLQPPLILEQVENLYLPHDGFYLFN